MADTQGTSEEAVSREPSPNTPDRPQIRIVLADSQAIYRVGMRKVFALEDDLRVVAQVDRIENLQAALERQDIPALYVAADAYAGLGDVALRSSLREDAPARGRPRVLAAGEVHLRRPRHLERLSRLLFLRDRPARVGR